MFKQLLYDASQDALTWDGDVVQCGQSLRVAVFDCFGDEPLYLMAILDRSPVRGWFLEGVPGISPVGIFADFP